MRLSWRLWVWVLVAVALVGVWVASLRHARTHKRIVDLSTTMPLNQPGEDVAPLEAYEVYSALYHAPMPEPLAFAEDSAIDIPQVNGSCLRATTPQEKEMADAFVGANQQIHRWEQKFSIPQGYRLLPPNKLAQAKTCLAMHQGDEQCAEFRRLRYVRSLGVPGFDEAHTRALVSVIKRCGPECGNGGIFVVEKTASSWQRAPTTDFTRDCSWMY
jgi:hypothetical protein